MMHVVNILKSALTAYVRYRVPLIALMLLSVFIFSFSYSSQVYKKKYKNAGFYQKYFSASVSVACGYGFKDIEEKIQRETGLFEFLRYGKKKSPFVEEFNCEKLKGARLIDPSPFQSAHRYLLYSVGMVWYFKGVKWRNLYVVSALLASFSWAAVVWMFSFFFKFELGFILTLFLIQNSVFNNFLIHLRDFSKAPFFLLSICMLIYFFRNASKGSGSGKMWIMSCILGILIGIGIGFRMDLKILILPILLIFSSSLFIKNKRKNFLIFCSSFLVLFTLFGSPILFQPAEKKAPTNWHILNAGLADRFDNELGLHKETYSKAIKYNDLFVGAQTESFNKRVLHLSDFAYFGETYDVVGKKVFIEWAKLFPADMYMRLLGSVVQILSLPRKKLLSEAFIKIHKLFLAGSLLILFFYLNSLPLVQMLILSATTLFIFAFPSLQFSLRHYFHFEPLAVLVAVVPFCLFVCGYKGGPPFKMLNWKSNIKKYTSTMLVFLLFFWIIPEALVSYQNLSVRKLVLKTVAMNNTSLESEVLTSADGLKVKPKLPISTEENDKDMSRVDYLIATLDLAKCSSPLNVKFQWISRGKYTDFSFERRFFFSKGNKMGYFIFPSHYIRGSSFDHFLLENMQGSECLAEIKKIENLNELKILPYFFVFGPIEKQEFSYFESNLFKLI